MRQIDVDVESPVSAADHPVIQDCEFVQPRPVTVSTPEQEPSVDFYEPAEEPVVIETTPIIPQVEKPSSETPKKVTAEEAEQSAAEVAIEIAAAEAVEKPAYCFPPIDLLQLPGNGASDGSAAPAQAGSRFRGCRQSGRGGKADDGPGKGPLGNISA